MTEAPRQETVPLGTSGVEVSRLGFGCCPMGGHGWGRTDEREMIDAVRSALAHGIQLFDTADVYGLGQSESTLGKALETRRHEAFVATKFGVRRDGGGKTYYDNSPEWATEALHSSLRRLRTDYIDLYQVHRWDGITPLEVILDVLMRFRETGKVRFFGVTNMDLISAGLKSPPHGLVSFSHEYSLAKRESEELIRSHIDALKLTFFSWGSLGQGILTGKYDGNPHLEEGDRRRRSAYDNFHGTRLRRNLDILQCIRRLLPEYPGRTTSQLALRWILDFISGSVVLVGIKRSSQLLNNLGCLNWQMSPKHVRALAELS